MIRKNAFQIFGIAFLSAAWVRRQPLWLVQGLIGTIGFIITLVAWGGNLALENMVIAYIVISPWTQGVNVVGQFFGLARNQHELERLVASPVSLPIYFLGLVFGTLPFMLIGLIPALVLVVIIKVSAVSFLKLVLLEPVGLVIGTFFSLAIVLRMKNASSVSAITNPLTTFTTILPPIYYPLTLLPSSLRIFTLLVPTVSLMELGRFSLGYETGFGFVIPSLILCVWLAITSVLMTKKLSWGME